MISHVFYYLQNACLTYYTSIKSICILQIFEQDLERTSTFKEVCMILLQKESLFSFILVLIHNVSCELLRLHMQFSHNSNNVLEHYKTYENAISTDI